MTTAKLKARYRVNEDGTILHHGDCTIFSFSICTCGLLHDLLPLCESAVVLYPDFWDELDKHEQTLDGLRKTS